MVAHIMKFTLEGIGVIRGSLGHKLPVLGQISENVLVVSIPGADSKQLVNDAYFQGQGLGVIG